MFQRFRQIYFSLFVCCKSIRHRSEIQIIRHDNRRTAAIENLEFCAAFWNDTSSLTIFLYDLDHCILHTVGHNILYLHTVFGNSDLCLFQPCIAFRRGRWIFPQRPGAIYQFLCFCRCISILIRDDLLFRNRRVFMRQRKTNP